MNSEGCGNFGEGGGEGSDRRRGRRGQSMEVRGGGIGERGREGGIR